jgi:hypothetical protein
MNGREKATTDLLAARPLWGHEIHGAKQIERH